MPTKLIELIKQCYIKDNSTEHSPISDFSITPEETTLKSWLLGGNEEPDEEELDLAKFFGVPDQEVKDEDFIKITTKNIKTSTADLLIKAVEEEKAFGLKRDIFIKNGLSVIISDGRVWDLVIFEVKPEYVEEVKKLVKIIPDLLIDDDVLNVKPDVFNYYGGECNFYQENERLFAVSGTSG